MFNININNKKMLTSLLVCLLISNALTLKREKSILFSRIVITGFSLGSMLTYYSIQGTTLSKGVGIYGGLFNITTFTQAFNFFIFAISAVILILTAFYPRKAFLEKFSSPFDLIFFKWSYNKIIISNKTGGQYRIIEYALIIVFVICGSLFLMSTGDLISIFLSIELQSYGLYILCTLYRDSESSTASGLTYFLLGGLSSCFILFGSSLLYANSGTTNLDNIYIITSISDMPGSIWGVPGWDIMSSLYSYQPYYFHISLIIMSVGFLFKVSAAPFHFWSPVIRSWKSYIVICQFICIIAIAVGCILPNSGQALKLQVPNTNRKVECGWRNYSCKVITLKISEKNVGYRGSKSTILYNIAVKEQRVDGSKYKIIISYLRYTLMFFERNYQIRILSNQINQKRLYSSLNINSDTNLNIVQVINPWFITGFTWVFL